MYLPIVMKFRVKVHHTANEQHNWKDNILFHVSLNMVTAVVDYLHSYKQQAWTNRKWNTYGRKSINVVHFHTVTFVVSATVNLEIGG